MQIAKNFWSTTLILLLYCLPVDLYRERVSANILLLLLLNNLRLYADGDDGGDGHNDIAN